MTATKAPQLDWETTSRVLSEERLFEPSDEVVENANVTAYMRSKGFSTYDELHAWSVEHVEEFWSDMAGELHWFKPWDKVLDWQAPYAQWFTGAETNIVYNALDRHMTTPIRNKVAFYWEGEDGATRTISYSDLYYEVTRFANALQNLGLKQGDRVVIYMPRIPEQIVAMMAAARIGVVHSVVYSGFSAQALRDRIQDAEAKAVITADGYYYRGKIVSLKDIVDDAVRQCASIQKVITVQRTSNQITWHRGRDVWYHDLLELASPYGEAVSLDSEATLYMLYTSGTTGKPKGIVHVHGGYMVGIYATIKFVFDMKPDDVFWCSADPGWVTGHSYIVYGPLIAGATSIFYEGAVDYPDPGRIWRMIERYGVTTFYTSPTAIRSLMRFGEGWPGASDLTTLRLLGTVGEPINPEAWIWYRKVCGDHQPVMDTWWQTETGMHMITPTPIMPLKPGSATKEFLGISATVVDKAGNEVGANQGGYLVVRKPWPSMMRTIYKDPERYEAYWNTIPGMYFAGDAAHRDADGYFWIQGRVDDVIKKSGYRLGSSEIESALVSHEAVAEAAVIGKPDEVKGEAIKAFVILRTGYEANEQLLNALRLHVRENVGPIAVPEEIDFVTSLPKTRSGKIMRRVLKAKELGQEVGDLSTLEE
ncbi:MAG TPA: acetate--CoA ligase [Thermomicrobiales bacterium]|nr:acetate--CoA ligase [Thermomicrobiales bacterium]